MLAPIFYLAGGFLWIVNTIFGQINIILPSQIPTALVWAFGSVNVFNGILPVATIMQAFLLVLGVWITMYGLKLFMHTIFPLIPFFGHRIELPRQKHPDQHKK